MWLLLALLFMYMALVHMSALYMMVSYRIPATKFNVWWLRNYQHYHKTRQQYSKYTQMLLDVFFKVDGAVNDATFGSTPRERISIQKVWRMPYEDGSALADLIDQQQVLTWNATRVPFEGGDIVQGAVQGESECLQALLSHVVSDAVDMTDEFKEMWCDEKNGFIVVSNVGFITFIEFSGYANVDQGIAAQKFRTVYTSPTIVFPPQHPNTCASKGIGTRQVLNATMEGEDVSGVIKSLAGPHNDFFEKDNALSYMKLWITFWFATGMTRLGEVVIEDTLMDETVF